MSLDSKYLENIMFYNKNNLFIITVLQDILFTRNHVEI